MKKTLLAIMTVLLVAGMAFAGNTTSPSEKTAHVNISSIVEAGGNNPDPSDPNIDPEETGEGFDYYFWYVLGNAEGQLTLDTTAQDLGAIANLSNTEEANDAITFTLHGTAQVAADVSFDYTFTCERGFVHEDYASQKPLDAADENKYYVPVTFSSAAAALGTDEGNNADATFDVTDGGAGAGTLNVDIYQTSPLTSYHELGTITMSWTPVTTLEAGTYTADITIKVDVT